MSSDPGRRRRFENLVGEVHDPLMRYLLRRMPRHDAEETMSDVLLVMWQRLDTIPVPTPLPWCYAVARRAMANRRRGDRRRLALIRRLEAQPKARYDDTAAAEDLALAEALDRLTPTDREVVTLWAWEGLEPREIAQVLDTTSNAVSIRLSRIKSRLATELARKNPPLAGHKGSEDTGDRP